MNPKRSPKAKPASSKSSTPVQCSTSQPPNPPSELFPIVGIGASAGGLEAFTQLLSHLPIDTGMAFVLVQHLDPNQKSLLTEILSRTTQMPVCEVQEGMTVAPNHVYVIPPNTTMTIDQGVLHLRPREKTRKVSMSIDTFFCSLANDRGAKAIGVILSGGDADGSRGLEAIKAAGGITFAQSEDSAQVSSMPNTAIATGHVDFILPPIEIAQKLAHISRHPYVTSPIPTGPTAELDGKDALSAIFSLLRAATRVDFTHYKHTTIKRRIFRRMALYRLEQFNDYVCYLQENPAEVQALYQEILINVTSFFRDAEAFAALTEKVFPALLHDRSPDLPIRVWVAGCSTGEEAYSIAICLLEFLANQPRKPPIQIFATDVSELAIDKARLGFYQHNQVTDISPDRLQRFFTRSEEGYQINKSVRELCIFARQNLISDPPFSRLDLISCRNVFIYFGTSLQKKVLSMFHYGLMPTGFLFLGTSETIGESPDLFTLIDRKYKIYAKRPAPLRLNLDLIASGYPVEMNLPSPIVAEASRNELELSQAADQIVLQQYAPVGVVINAQLEILQFRGQTGAYLEPSPGRASLNLLTMVKEGLRLELRTAIHQAKQDRHTVRKEGITLRETVHTQTDWSVRTRQIRIDVIPFQPNPASEDCFLILFEDLPALPASEITLPMTQRSQSKGQQPSSEQQEIQRLQQELSTTKAYLQSIIEEQQSTNQDLRAANEEILSSNEELQSTNEELQTAKEEIQATNEELSTINDELYRRNAETTQVSNDLQNLLGSINIPLLMLESDLRIRRFTATAASLFNLIPTDIGRPLSDIKHNLSIVNLEQQILDVINTLNLHSQEVQDLTGHWYDLRIRPYRTLDNRIDGAVVVLVDIDTLKQSTEQLREARDYAEAIVQTVREALLVLNTDLQVITANQTFYETFEVTPSETEQCFIFDLGNGQWNIPQLRSLLGDVLHQNSQIQNFAVEHYFEHIGHKIMLLNARKMPQLAGSQLILLAIEDISDRPSLKPN
ncbi:chemotaxis protein CheB [Alkalinema sp. FACHB-956]|uniref:chemotaxis protein CheB n=1 Tax=Alkalinema sp. FACHB-956 TaxID=2692768 RepID=UPI0016836793|nr:PAS domain-containing protein [Alkalinema sp. FACHB-956]